MELNNVKEHLNKVSTFDSPQTKQILLYQLNFMAIYKIALPDWEQMTERFFNMLYYPNDDITPIWTHFDEIAYTHLLEYYKISCINYFNQMTAIFPKQ